MEQKLSVKDDHIRHGVSIRGFVGAYARSSECGEGQIWAWSGAEAVIMACGQEAGGGARRPRRPGLGRFPARGHHAAHERQQGGSRRLAISPGTPRCTNASLQTVRSSCRKTDL
jgi:hypothetical protein